MANTNIGVFSCITYDVGGSDNFLSVEKVIISLETDMTSADGKIKISVS